MLAMGRNQSVWLLDDKKLLDDIIEMTSVTIDHYCLIKLTAIELVRMTKNVQYKSRQLQGILKRSEEDVGKSFYLAWRDLKLLPAASEADIKHLNCINEASYQLQLCKEIIQVKLSLLKVLGKKKQ